MLDLSAVERQMALNEVSFFEQSIFAVFKTMSKSHKVRCQMALNDVSASPAKPFCGSSTKSKKSQNFY